MKSLYKFSTLTAMTALLVGTGYSCKNSLDVNPQGEITEAQIISDPNVASNLVTGIYNIFFAGDAFGNDVRGFQFTVLGDIASDDADKGSTASDYGDANTLDQLTANGNNGVVNNIWKGYYQAIARANQALSQLQNAQFDATVKNRLIGEARFLRAMFYFNLVRIFGGVPLLDRVPAASEANSPQFQTRATAEDIYKFVIADLTFAAENLPVIANNSADVGRASKGAAQALLSKVYLYNKDYTNAYAMSDAVIKSNNYSLLADYTLLFRQVSNNSKESIFEIQAGQNLACNAAIDRFTVAQGPRAGGKNGWVDRGYGFNNPSQSLVNEFEAGDVRKNATIITINPSNGANSVGTVLYDGFRIPTQDSVQNQRYNYKAYYSRQAEPNCGNFDRLPKHVMVIRYAEVLLIHAEAALQTGQGGIAQSDINQLRTRAKVPTIGIPTLQQIWHERRVELAMEQDRFFDLVRQDAVQPGRAAAAFAADGKTWNANRALFPIPQQQIDLSGGLLKPNPSN
ncbi:RagB/SusD family nutrient uptake outer membrane protein [Mucilaginibacter aquatilis]|uniref:RagB/SusD family nutrient uptake outer membrane protein n=1 Tax=Mucilaginibacter aquatilis TaxID=1517760 RepID=A0A6I4IF30_9SPHI|nr:RagB/SusD family nutrient uptake outer membrane protein [Mucilaginibacter aquatilis]MVN91969.1 RagB/SusD family nutrient uptake outer membrane protein [Mucilaginibacter aquatilis]